MTWDITLLIAILFGIGSFLVIQGNWLRFLFGNILFSNAVNVFVLAMSRNPKGKTVPIIDGIDRPLVDPLPQALILTAIVISFGLTAFLTVYLYRLYQDRKTTRIALLYPKEEG